MEFYKKIIRDDCDDQLTRSVIGRVKKSFILGALLFFLNFFFIMVICFMHSGKDSDMVVVALQGDNVTAQAVDDKAKISSDSSLLLEESGNSKNDSGNNGTNKDSTANSGKKSQEETADNEDSQSDNQDKCVYLTFDDGPSDNTEKILDILEEYQVKATFFVVGREDDESKRMYQRIVNEGHTIGMHSYSHDYQMIYKSKKAFLEDYDKIHSLIYDVTGVDTVYYRFPGGSSNTVSSISMKNFIKILDDKGITYFDWNAMSGDAEGKNLTNEEMMNNVLKDVKTHKTSVVLMHDSSDKQKTVEMLPGLIETLQEEEYELLPIDDDTKPVQHVTLDDK